jgi:hypothetical protein
MLKPMLMLMIVPYSLSYDVATMMLFVARMMLFVARSICRPFQAQPAVVD